MKRQRNAWTRTRIASARLVSGRGPSRTRQCAGTPYAACVAIVLVLLNAPLLGCSFTAPAASVQDDMDDPNSYTCSCRCSAPSSQMRAIRIAAAADDAEQTPSTGAIDTDPTDLDFGIDRAGLRFTAVAIPPMATILSAHIQFTADQAFGDNGATVTNLAIIGEAADNAAPYTTTPFNMTSRSATLAAVAWTPPAWAINQSGPAQLTPDLRNIIQEIVDRPGWQSGNALAMQISGVGRREAETFDGNPQRAAVLQVEFVAVTTQDLATCMPAELNPNLGENEVPSDVALQLDCEHRVEKTLHGLAGACGYPSACACRAIANSRGFNAACNDPCVETPLAPGCSNFDPSSGTTTATNAPGDEPVCLALRDPSAPGPQPMARHIYGMDSLCEVEGEATLSVGGEDKTTGAAGTVLLGGEPCPGAPCAVGVAYDFDLDPITFAVKFFSDPTFVDLTSTGASEPGVVQIGPAGIGTMAAETTETSVRGRRNSNTKAFVVTNQEPVGLAVAWEDHACALFGALATNVDSEDPDIDEDEVLSAEIHVDGEIVNEPPLADPGADRTLECTSHGGAVVMLDGSESSDPENNIVSFQWFRDSRVGELLGTDQKLEVPQALGGASTYVLRVLDSFGQGSEKALAVGIVDTTAPEIDCNAPPTIRPPDTALSFTATGTDACDAEVVAEITGFKCFRFEGNGKPVDKTHSCGVKFAGNKITIPRSNGVGNHIAWTVRAADDSGNTSVIECAVEVVN
jgi:hypothetical protein